jgi:spore coat protein U-like protein
MRGPLTVRSWARRAACVGLLFAGGAANVDAACTISASGVSFGSYDVFVPAPTDSTGTVVYRCGNTDKDVRITLTTGSSGTFVARTLRKTSDQVVYNLFREAARTTVWGDGTGSTGYYFDRNPPNNQDVVVTVYGRIPALQDAAAGSYTDAVIVQVDF